MRIRHFEALRPVCPACRGDTSPSTSALRIAESFQGDDQWIEQGILHCRNPECLREFPIVDGIPFLITDLRTYVSHCLTQILARTDLAEPIESLLGDCCAGDSPYDAVRQQLSSYAWDHYGDGDPDGETTEPRAGSVLRLLDAGIGLLPQEMDGPILDAGCGVGGGTFALADRTEQLVLGVDLNVSMLRLATEVLRTGRVRYPLRRVGAVYDRREFEPRLRSAELVDFWACDACALPMAGRTFGTVVSLNVLDSVRSPLDHLRGLADVLKDGGQAVVGCPYDWTSAATPKESWFGGHSQRGSGQGDSRLVLRRLLDDANGGCAVDGLRIVAELDRVGWQVRLHQRALLRYETHLLALQRRVRSQVEAPNA